VRKVARRQCGHVCFECEGDPLRVSVCHCLDCQRRSGSAFAAQVRFSGKNVTSKGTWHEFVRVADSGANVLQQFCPRCGTGVSYHSANAPEIVAIPLGLFEDPYTFEPAFSVYEHRRHPWLAVTGNNIEHQD